MCQTKFQVATLHRQSSEQKTMYALLQTTLITSGIYVPTTNYFYSQILTLSNFHAFHRRFKSNSIFFSQTHSLVCTPIVSLRYKSSNLKQFKLRMFIIITFVI